MNITIDIILIFQLYFIIDKLASSIVKHIKRAVRINLTYAFNELVIFLNFLLPTNVF